MQRLRAASFRAIGAVGGKMQWHRCHGEQFPALLFWPAKVDHYADFLRRTMAEGIRIALGNNVRQLTNQFYYRIPGDGDAFNYHRDLMFRDHMHDDWNPATDYLQTVICVDDWTEDNGAIWFTDEILDTDLEHLRDDPGDMRGEMIAAHSGDVVVWSASVSHASKPNVSQSHRLTYMNGFARAEICDEEAGPWYLKDGIPVCEMAA
jgi:ectoine hydroxylase-related dioxygenase (phytanoyl-CoA dioxygenase family)